MTTAAPARQAVVQDVIDGIDTVFQRVRDARIRLDRIVAAHIGPTSIPGGPEPAPTPAPPCGFVIEGVQRLSATGKELHRLEDLLAQLDHLHGMKESGRVEPVRDQLDRPFR